jgi:hypothetical protein
MAKRHGMHARSDATGYRYPRDECEERVGYNPNIARTVLKIRGRAFLV